MRRFTHVRSMGELEARIAEVLDQLAADSEPVLITRNGKACAVLQDIQAFRETHETLALLKLLALGQREVDAGKLTPAGDVVARLKAKSAATGK